MIAGIASRAAVRQAVAPACDLRCLEAEHMEGLKMDNNASQAMLAKSRRLVLLSRNLLRVLGRRLEVAERASGTNSASVRIQPGGVAAMRSDGV